MKCLTLAEFREWAAFSNVELKHDRNLVFPMESKQEVFGLPQGAYALFALSVALVEWMPPNDEQAFYLSDWPLYTPEQMIMFMNLRLAGGESRDPDDAPAHLFSGRTLPDRYEIEDMTRLTADPVLKECAAMMSLIFLAMSFQWHGYILAKNCGDYIYLGDEFIAFHSVSQEARERTDDLAIRFKLKAH